ncbi:hypothetical protein BB050_03023 [Flavobacterium anhuiense]|uniref:Uncharacterized protein n=1 Tax=Flavobacterium anhuiense TaxID=459526 RepID=A0AAC9GJ83_9FLAO|nr:hypothetical protein [Flavobacterium anhuiense]AOC96113.1 hypothetical protein BB050_03023 [Flavobacterium anhuiense]
MYRFSEVLISIIPTLFLFLVFGAIWFVVRKVFRALSDKINNSENYKEDTLRVLEEIRDELKELNRNK